MMKTPVFMLVSLLVPLLALCGCNTAKPGAANVGGSAARAEAGLASSQSKAILKDRAIAEKTVFQTGDKISVHIWLKDKVTQLSGFPVELDIGESGQVFLPHVGVVKLSGKTVADVRAELQANLEKTLNDITVIVARKGERTFVGVEGKSSVELGRHFIVMGHITRPGMYPLEHGLRVRDAIAIAGGLAHYGHPNIYLVRGDRYKPEVKRVNLNDILYGDNLGDNVLLTANDAIYVAPKMLYTIADFVQLLLSPITSMRDTLWVYDRIQFNQE